MDIYEELGLRPFINAYRPLTRLGGAVLPSCVTDAMCQASRRNVSLEIMQRSVGASIASMTRNEGCYVSCGAAAGITLAVSACMAGTDSILAERLPNSNGMKNEVIMYTAERGRKSDVAIKCAGAKIVEIGDESGASIDDLNRSINDRSAAFFMHCAEVPGKIPIGEVIRLAEKHRLPVLVDAAFAVPPRETFWKFTRDHGADAVFVSGGKNLHGPQTTGLVLGRRWVIEGCAFHGVPNSRIGRGMKVGKEELAGIYAAVKQFMLQDEVECKSARVMQIEHILERIKDIPGVKIARLNPMTAGVSLVDSSGRFSSRSASRWLLENDPSVYVEPANGYLAVSSECLCTGEETVVADQLQKLFTNLGRTETIPA